MKKNKTTGIGVTIHVEIDDQRDSRRPARKRSQGSDERLYPGSRSISTDSFIVSIISPCILKLASRLLGHQMVCREQG